MLHNEFDFQTVFIILLPPPPKMMF